MATSTKHSVPERSRTELPRYALQIRSLREAAGLSQPEFAKKLGLARAGRPNSARGTIAHWEAGSREPRARNYLALATFAREYGQLPLAEIFEALSQQRNLTALVDRRKDVPPRTLLMATWKHAAMGDQEAKRLLALSRVGKTAYWNQLREEINRRLSALIEEETRDPGNRLLSTVLAQLLGEAEEIEKLRIAREELKRDKGH